MPVNLTVAQRIRDDILSADNRILAVSLIDMEGDILAAKSKQSFKETFGVTADGEKYGGTLAVATLSLVNEVKDVVGNPQAIITIHSNCKLMLLPISSYKILVGLVLERSVNVEDDNFAKKIEKLIADRYDAKLIQ